MLGVFSRAPQPLYAFLSAGICAWKQPLGDEKLLELFQHAGASHVLCVSGAHLALVSSFIMSVLKPLSLRNRTKICICMCCCICYVGACAGSLSSVRACLLVVSSFLADIAGVKRHTLSCVCLAASCMLMADPYASHAVSFMFSLASVLGLCLYSDYVLLVLTRARTSLLTKLASCAYAQNFDIASPPYVSRDGVESPVLNADHRVLARQSRGGNAARRARACSLRSSCARGTRISLIRLSMNFLTRVVTRVLTRLLTSRVMECELSIIAQSFVCQLCTFPLTLLLFGGCSVYAVLANCCAVQLVMLVLSLGFVALICSCVPWIVALIFSLAQMLSLTAIFLLTLQTKLPWSYLQFEEGRIPLALLGCVLMLYCASRVQRLSLSSNVGSS